MGSMLKPKAFIDVNDYCELRWSLSILRDVGFNLALSKHFLRCRTANTAK